MPNTRHLSDPEVIEALVGDPMAGDVGQIDHPVAPRVVPEGRCPRRPYTYCVNWLGKDGLLRCYYCCRTKVPANTETTR